MKKITLLFTLLCTAALNGMEAQRIGDLPKELQEKITKNINDILNKALTSSNNPEDTIKAIKAASASQGIRYDNLNDFTRLVQIIARRFPQEFPTDIAKKFKTPTAKNYIKLTKQLNYGIIDHDITIVESAIQNGADVNTLFLGSVPISTTINKTSLDIVKLLIKAGVDANSARKAQFIASIRENEWHNKFMAGMILSDREREVSYRPIRSHLIDQIIEEMKK